MRLFLLMVLVGFTMGAVLRRRPVRQGGQISFFNQTVMPPVVPGVPPGTIDQFQGVVQGGQQALGGASQGFFPQPPPGFFPTYSTASSSTPPPANEGQSDELAGRKGPRPDVVPIVNYDFQSNPSDGSYRFSYETGDGTKREEVGRQKAVGEPPELGSVAQGSYSYVDPDGNHVSVSYTADERGFIATGNHLPTEHPVPQPILASLEVSAANEAAQNGGAISPAYHHYFRNAYRRHYQQ